MSAKGPDNGYNTARLKQQRGLPSSSHETEISEADNLMRQRTKSELDDGRFVYTTKSRHYKEVSMSEKLSHAFDSLTLREAQPSRVYSRGKKGENHGNEFVEMEDNMEHNSYFVKGTRFIREVVNDEPVSVNSEAKDETSNDVNQMATACISFIERNDYRSINNKLNEVTNPQELRSLIQRIVHLVYGHDVKNFSKMLNFAMQQENVERRLLVYDSFFHEISQSNHLYFAQVDRLLTDVKQQVIEKFDKSIASPIYPRAVRLAAALENVKEKIILQKTGKDEVVRTCAKFSNEGRFLSLTAKLEQIIDPDLAETVLMEIIHALYGNNRKNFDAVLNFLSQVNNATTFKSKSEGLVKKMEAWTVDNLTRVCQSLLEQEKDQEVEAHLKHLTLSVKKTVICKLVRALYHGADNGFRKVVNWGSSIQYDLVSRFLVYQALFDITEKNSCALYSQLIDLRNLVKERVDSKLQNRAVSIQEYPNFKTDVSEMIENLTSIIIKVVSDCCVSLIKLNNMHKAASQLLAINDDDDLNKAIIQAIITGLYKGLADEFKVIIQFGNVFPLSIQKYFIYEILFKNMKYFNQLNSNELMLLSNRIKPGMLHRLEDANNSNARELLVVLDDEIKSLVIEREVEKATSLINSNDNQGLVTLLNELPDEDFTRPIIEGMVKRIYSGNMKTLQPILPLGSAIDLEITKRFFVYEAMLKELEHNNFLLSTEFFQIVSKVNLEIIELNGVPDSLKTEALNLRNRLEGLVKQQAILECTKQLKIGNVEAFIEPLDKIVNSTLMQVIIEEVIEQAYSENSGQIEKIADFIEKIGDEERRVLIYQALFHTLKNHNGLFNIGAFQVMSNVEKIIAKTDHLHAVNRKAKKLAGELRTLIEESTITECVKLVNESKFKEIEAKLSNITDFSLIESIIEGAVTFMYGRDIVNFPKTLSFVQSLSNRDRRFLAYKTLFNLVEKNHYQHIKELFELISHISHEIVQSSESSPSIISQAKSFVDKISPLVRDMAVTEFSTFIRNGKINDVSQKLERITESSLVVSVLQGIVLQVYKGKHSDFKVLMKLGEEITSRKQSLVIHQTLVQVIQAYPPLPHSIELFKELSRLQKEINLPEVSSIVKQQVQELINQIKKSEIEKAITKCVNATNKNNFKGAQQILSSLEDPVLVKNTILGVVAEVYNNKLSNFEKILGLASTVKNTNYLFWIYDTLFKIMKEQDHLHGLEISQLGDKLHEQIVLRTDDANEIRHKAKKLAKDAKLFIDRNKMLPKLDLLREKVNTISQTINSQLSNSTLERSQFDGMKKRLVNDLKFLSEQAHALNREIRDNYLGDFIMLTEQIQELQIKLDEANENFLHRRKKIEEQITKNEQLLTIVKQAELTLIELTHLQELIELEGADVAAVDEEGWTPLHYAADKGHKTAALYLLARGAPVNAVTTEGDTPLHRAAQSGYSVIVRILLEKNAQIVIKNKKGMTPRRLAQDKSPLIWDTLLNSELFQVVKQGDIRKVEHYVNIDADINARDHRDWTPLHYAAFLGHTSVVKFLTKIGAGINAKSKDQWSVIHCASYSGDLSIIRTLAIKGHTEFNVRLSASVEKPLQGATPVHIAAWRGHTDVVEYFLKEISRERGFYSDIHVDEESSVQSWTPLHFAAAGGHHSTVNALLKNNASLVKTTKAGDNALHVAARYGHTTLVKSLVDQGLSVNETGESGWTLLHYASQSGQIELVDWIFRQNSDLMNRTNALGAKALHVAAQHGHIETVKFFLGKNSDVNEPDLENWTPLHYAVLGNDKERVDMVAFLLEVGATVNASTRLTDAPFSGVRPLHIAGQYGYYKTVEILIKSGELLVARDNQPRQWTALHYASQGGLRKQPEEILGVPLKPLRCGHGKVLEFLISSGAQRDPSSFDDRGDKPIHIAAEEGHFGLVRLFIKNGSNVDCTNNENWTPLHYASKSGHLDVVQLLARNRASKRALTKDGKEPMHFAMQGRHEAVIKFFLEELGIDELDSRKRTTLHYAVEMGESKWVKFLLDKRANVAAQDKDGLQPLHLAAKKGYFHVTKQLVEMKANVNAVDRRDQTPLHYAASSRNYAHNRLKIVKYLVDEHGADVNSMDNYSENPIHYASRDGVTNVLEYFANIQWSPTELSFPLGENNWSLLHYAAKGGHLDNVKFLIEFLMLKGIKINEALTDDEETPLDIADQEGNQEIKNYLEQMINQQDQDEYARDRNRRSVETDNQLNYLNFETSPFNSASHPNEIDEKTLSTNDLFLMKVSRIKRASSGVVVPQTRKFELIEQFLNNPVGGRTGIDSKQPITSVTEASLANSNTFDPNSPQGFAQHFSLFLERTPTVLSGSKQEFLSHLFYGSVMTLPHTELMEELGVKKILLKTVSEKTIKLFFVIEKEGRKRLVFNVVTSVAKIDDGQKCSNQELTEISKLLEISRANMQTYEAEGTLFHVKERKLFVSPTEMVEKSAQGGVNNDYKSKLSELAATLDQLTIADEGFIEVKKNSLVKALLESKVKYFSSDKTASVKKYSKEFSQSILKMYNAKTQKALGILSAREAGIHAFYYGALAFNFKYRFSLDIHIERISGKGYVDLIFLSREKNNGKNWQAVPVVIEFKADSTSSSEAISQIKGTGYLYSLGMRTVAEKAVVLGINSYPGIKEAVVAGIETIPQSQGFLKQFLNKPHSLNERNIKTELEHLFKSFSNLAVKKKTERYLNGLVLGEILGTGDEIKKYIFLHEGKNVKNKLSTFLIRGEDTNLWVLLNLIEEGTEANKNIAFPPEELENSGQDKLIQVDIEINSMAKDGFSAENPKRLTGNEMDNEYYYHKVTVKQEVNINTYQLSRNKYPGELKPIGSFDANTFFADGPNVQEGALRDLSETLKPLNPFINSESDFQAVTQGLFMEKSTDGKILKVFCELNPSKEGRIDLLLLLLSKGTEMEIQEDKLILMELKYDPKARADQNPERNHYLIDAETQWPKYVGHLKSITDLPKATIISAVYSKLSGEILQKVHENVVIPHTSPALRPIASPLDLEPLPHLELPPARIDEMPDAPPDKRLQPDQGQQTHDGKKRKIDVICSSSTRRSKRSTQSKLCIFKLDDNDIQPDKTKVSEIESEKSILGETKLSDLDVQKISEIDGEALVKYMKDVPESERNQLIEIASKAKNAGTKVVASDEFNKAINELAKEQKFQSDASKVENVVKKIKSGEIIEDLALPNRGDMKGVAIGPKLLAEAVDNYQKQQSTKVSDKSPVKVNPFDKSYRYLNKINLGIMGKDLIGKILSGDEKSLGIMAGLIVGDKVAEKVAEKMAEKGFKFVQAGKYLKGNLLKASAPIIGSVTSGFQVYSLVSNVNQFKNLTETCSKEQGSYEVKKCTIDKSVTVAGIVGDSISLATTAVTVGMQAFRLISMGLKAAATSTGPVGIALIVIDVLANIAVQIYSAVKQVESIELLIRLTGGERFKEGLRGFFGMEISKYLENLMKIKQGNNQLVRGAVEFLKNSLNIERYVFPSYDLIDYNCRTVEKNGFETDKASCIVETIFTFGVGALPCALITTEVTECDKKLESYPNSRVFLDSMQSFTIDRASPDSSGQGESIFCTSSSSDGIENQYTYRCDNAIGVRYPYNRNSPHYTLIDLKEGNDEAVGTTYNSNIFLVNQGEKHYKGGSRDDTFILQAAPIRGHLNGFGGNNTIVLDASFSDNHPVTVDLHAGHVKHGQGVYLSVEHFNVALGREKKSETIIAGCDTVSINGQGGHSRNSFDFINILNKGIRCRYSLSVKVNDFTRVTNEALYGMFSYVIPSRGDFTLTLNLEGEANHFHLLNDPARDIRIIQFDARTTEVTILNEQGGTFVQKLKSLRPGEDFYAQPKFSTIDQVFIQIDKRGGIQGYIHMAEGNDKSVSALLNYPNLFMIDGGYGTLTGGHKDDIFVLKKYYIRGYLDGQGGDNKLVVGNEFMPGGSIKIDLFNNLLTMGHNQEAKINGIKVVVGRENNKETVVAACDTTTINGQGGNSYQWDEIKILDTYCRYELRLPVSAFTKVVNQARQGNFHYEIHSEGNAQIEINPLGNANHVFLFQETARTLKEIIFNKDTESVSISNYRGKIVDQGLKPLGTRDLFYEQPQLITRDPLEIKIDREGEVHGIAKLNEETSDITGLLNYPNTFLFEGGNKYLSGRGGNSNDLFILQHIAPRGALIDGEGGINTLMLKESYASGQKVVINLGRIGVLKTVSSNDNITLQGIRAVIGRYSQSEVISAFCDTLSIESQGGTPSEFDEIVIPENSDCHYNLKIEAKKYTKVENHASTGTFSYKISKEGAFFTQLRFTNEVKHYFLLENNLNELTHLHFDDTTPSLSIFNQQGGHFTLPLKALDELEDFYTQPRFTTNDNFEIKISRQGNLVASSKTAQTTEQTIFEYSGLANQLQTTLLFNSNSGNDLIHIGVNNSLDILTNSPYSKSHLVGNGGENIYVIATNDQDIVSEKQPLISIPEVVIYNFNPGEKADVLDLSPIIRSIRQTTNSRYSPTIQQEANDLCILIKSNQKLITTVRLKDILLNKQEEKMQIILSQVRMQLKQSSHPKKRSIDWALKPVPLEVKRDTEVLLLTSEDVEDHMDITELKSDSFHYDFAHSDNDLIITNLFSEGVANRDRLTIVLKDYSKEPLLQTLTMQFPDKGISLSEQSSKFIFKNYSEIKNEHQEVVYSNVFKQVVSQENEENVYVPFTSDAKVLISKIPVAGSNFPAASRESNSNLQQIREKTKIDRNGGDLYHAFSAGAQLKVISDRAVNSYLKNPIIVEEISLHTQTLNKDTSESYFLSQLYYVVPSLVIASVSGLLVRKCLRSNMGEQKSVIVDAVAVTVPLMTLPTATETHSKYLGKQAAKTSLLGHHQKFWSTIKHIKTLNSSKTNLKSKPLTHFPFHRDTHNKSKPMIEAPPSNTNQAELTPAAYCHLDTIETYGVCKWLLGIFGKRAVVNRMNESEMIVNSYNSINQLDWIEKQLKTGIDTYGNKKEKALFEQAVRFKSY